MLNFRTAHPVIPKYLISRMCESRPTSIIDRIRRLIAEKAEGKQQKLAELTGIQSSMLSRLINGREPITRRHLIKLERATGARLSWLEYGIEPVYYETGKAPERDESEYFEGAMLRAYLDKHNIEYTELARRLGKSKNTVQGYFKTETLGKANRLSILDALNATYEQVFSGLAAHQVNGHANGSTNGSRIRPVEVNNYQVRNILRIPIRARAGLGYESYFSDAPKEREYIPVSEDRLYPGIPEDRHVVVEVNGDSMEPVLEHGYEVLAYSLLPGQFPSLNRLVLVDFRDELTIKRLVGIDYIDETITLRSENGGAEARLPMSEIRSIYHVYDYYKARL